VYSRDGRLHGRAPSSGEVVVTAEHLVLLHPTLGPRLRGEISTDFRVDLVTGGLCFDPGEAGPTCPTLDPRTWDLQDLPRAKLRLRTRTGGGVPRTRTREARLGPDTAIVFERTSRDREMAAYDPTPTLVRPDGVRLRMRGELAFAGGAFVVDPATDEPITVAAPASVVVVHDGSRALSRLALEGRVLWRVDTSTLAPGDADPVIHSAHAAHKILVVYAGETLAGVDFNDGHVLWSYGAGATPAAPSGTPRGSTAP
jgi:hypothetical protein